MLLYGKQRFLKGQYEFKKISIVSLSTSIILVVGFIVVTSQILDLKGLESAQQCHIESKMVLIPIGTFTLGAGAKYSIAAIQRRESA